MLDPDPQALAVKWQDVSWSPPGGWPYLSRINLSVPTGSVMYLAGESGSGKTTLLKMVDRLLEPSSGEVIVDGRDVSGWDIRRLRRHAVYIPQRPQVLADTVGADLRMPLDWHGLPFSESMLREALTVAQLPDLQLDHPTRGLSEGQLGRLALARGLTLQPKILLLDEPTAALDPTAAQSMLAKLGQWARNKRATIVCVTHRLAERAALPGDVAVLHEGHLWGPFTEADFTEGAIPQPIASFLGTSQAAR